ncbi:hypothetical protein [Aeromicrobium chenweiae]|uniref:Uncharacterized protein n=1 Tax=Aeromicrobium chenweiae TaxID=2079793 RepID=A0A2S0WNU7_9ACTN|nr:hypothetical protein [Aeromicrobium chenweiae]AWB93018.1 hypothetical protein C3E78_12830 [Aeromicrobium chenweiae]TGN34008.1 hypothetical protein E4L97_02870 [Aeromicrobium chenweiae]
MRRTLTVLLTLLLTAAVLTACGSSDDGAGLDWSSTKAPVGADTGLVWADALTGEIHLSDGQTLDADRAISSFVVAGDGAYVVDKDDDALIEVTADGARPTGAHVETRAKASPSGRYLAFIDTLAGPKFEGTVHQLTSVVVDLKTGEEVFRSTRGMGDVEDDDLTDLYEDADYGVLAVNDETAWISVPEGDVLSIDLSTGKATSKRDTDTSNPKNPWVGPRFAPEPSEGPANPDRTWGISRISRDVPALAADPAFRFDRDELTSADGARLVPRTGAVSWRLEAWVDSETVVGHANDNLDNPDFVKDPKTPSLMTCTVPDGACTLVPDSEHAILPEPSLY